MATIDAPRAREKGFEAWLNEGAAELPLRVAVKRGHEQWYALLTQFDITGAGPTPHDAVNDAFELLFAYLRAYFEDGAQFADSFRPVPRSLRARIGAESLVGEALRRLSVRLPGPLTTEASYALPPGTLANLAHC